MQIHVTGDRHLAAVCQNNIAGCPAVRHADRYGHGSEAGVIRNAHRHQHRTRRGVRCHTADGKHHLSNDELAAARRVGALRVRVDVAGGISLVHRDADFIAARRDAAARNVLDPCQHAVRGHVLAAREGQNHVAVALRVDFEGRGHVARDCGFVAVIQVDVRGRPPFRHADRQLQGREARIVRNAHRYQHGCILTVQVVADGANCDRSAFHVWLRRRGTDVQHDIAIHVNLATDFLCQGCLSGVFEINAGGHPTARYFHSNFHGGKAGVILNGQRKHNGILTARKRDRIRSKYNAWHRLARRFGVSKGRNTGQGQQHRKSQQPCANLFG